MPDEAVEAAKQEPPELAEVWPEHVEAIRLFVACHDQWITQWLVSKHAARQYHQGLDYGRAAEVAGWLGIAKTPELFRQLEILVDEAKPIRNRD
ncbi:DUF1799 domain-containing protein [Ramlibacter sp.]|uniref:DUF1799 domain-containing protein n=1 Tax=Ramlibacter sp. TaxID=1917967 RepID=UPI003D0DD1E1